MGDTGELQGPGGRATVRATFRPIPEVIAHRVLVEEGVLSVGDRVAARVDEERRLDIARNHTTTHLCIGHSARYWGSMLLRRVRWWRPIVCALTLPIWHR